MTKERKKYLKCLISNILKNKKTINPITKKQNLLYKDLSKRIIRIDSMKDVKAIREKVLESVFIQFDTAFYYREDISEFIRKANFQRNYFNNFFLIRTFYTENKDEVNHGRISVNCTDCKKAKDKNTVKAQIAYQTFDNKIRLDNLDTLLVSQNGLQTSPIVYVTINNTENLIFTHRITFEYDEDWILCGVV